MAQYIFKRTEKKYILNKNQYDTLVQIVEQHMEVDEFGKHTVCNLYLDTDDYRIIRKSIEKPVYKEKIRLRSYGVPTEDSEVFLELKKKYKGVVYKRRISLNLSDAKHYLETGECPSHNGQVMNEIDYFMKFYGKPVPKIFIAYDRVAYYTRDDDSFRITFDTNIRSRRQDLLLESGDAGESLFDEVKVIMEVKAGAVMPEWLIDTMEKLRIYPSSFSKYGTIYTEKLAKVK